MEKSSDKRTVKVLVQRHYESFFNQKIREWRHEQSTGPSGQCYEIKCDNSDEMVDCGITSNARSQAEMAAKALSNYPDIKFVFASPLRRCIESTELTLSLYKGKKVEKITAIDAFRERLDSSCDIPVKTKELREAYKHIDFSFMDKFEIPDLWFIESLSERHKESVVKIIEEGKKQNERAEAILKKVREQMIAKIDKERPIGGEINSEMVERAKGFRKRLAEEIQKIEKEKGEPVKDCEILICAHSRILLFSTAKTYDEETQAPLDGKQLLNGDIYEWEFEMAQNS